MKRYIDLSGTLRNDLWSYDVLPGLEKLIPPVSIETIATVKNNDFFASKITCSSVSGTYLEAGSHIRENGKNLDRIKAKRGTLICLPLAVAGTSGAPARVVFEEEG